MVPDLTDRYWYAHYCGLRLACDHGLVASHSGVTVDSYTYIVTVTVTLYIVRLKVCRFGEALFITNWSILNGQNLQYRASLC